MDAQKIGTFIQTRRKALGLTQGSLGEKLNVTDKAISRWERGVGLPDIQLLEPLAEALHVTVLELMRGECMEEASIPVEAADAVLTDTLTLAKRKKHGRVLLVFLCFAAYFVVFALRHDPKFYELGWLFWLEKVGLLCIVGLLLYASRKEDGCDVE